MISAVSLSLLRQPSPLSRVCCCSTAAITGICRILVITHRFCLRLIRSRNSRYRKAHQRRGAASGVTDSTTQVQQQYAVASPTADYYADYYATPASTYADYPYPAYAAYPAYYSYPSAIGFGYLGGGGWHGGGGARGR